MFYLLSNGEFLIYDGGQGKEDGDHLYSQLRRVADENGIRDVTVNAWIITHEHGDHMGFGKDFFAAYRDKINVRELWMNSLYEWGERFIQTVLKNQPKCVHHQLHTGERIQIADVTVEVLCTPDVLREKNEEELYRDSNNASIVTRLNVDELKILMSGDASMLAWDYMADTYGSALKSDILHVPHHGANHGATAQGYRLVNADTLIFNCGQEHFDCIVSDEKRFVCTPDCTHKLFNRHVSEYLSEFKGRIIVAGAYFPPKHQCIRFL
jgi:beta-lactamase superfamily II metal-dependent hydrolase